MSRFFLPRTPKDLWPIIADHPGAAVYAGGTDVLVKRRAGLVSPDPLVCLERIAALKEVFEEGEGVFLGAGATHAALLEHPLVRERFPVLAQALCVLGSPPIRRMGTLGGNLVTASPAGDTLPPLCCLDARVVLRSAFEEERVPVGAFVQGPGKTLLRPGWIVAGVWIPDPVGFNVHHFEKVGQRNALAISLVSLAAVLAVEGGRITAARLAWGSVGPTVVRSSEAEAALTGGRCDPATLEAAAARARAAVRPISDVRASAAYRRQVAGNLLLRLTS